MLYGIKKQMMKGIIGKRQKKNPFDYEAGESFALQGAEDPVINNSYYFSAHGTGNKQSLYCRLGQRTCYDEVWFYYSDGERRYALKEMLYKENTPLQVYRADGVWHICFEGALVAENGGLAQAKFEGIFTDGGEVIDFFSHMPAIRTAKAMAAEKWTKQWREEAQKNNQVHYEQTGVLKGVLTVDGKAVAIDLPCVRDHSFGTRDWNYMNNHLWLMAVNPTSQLNFSMVSYPMFTALEVGNFKPTEQPMTFVLQAEYDRKAVIAGKVPDELTLSLKLTDKRTINVVAKKTDVEAYVFQNGEYTLLEGVADFEIDGVPYRGIMELGFNGDSDRIFNGKDTGALKV